MRLVAARRLAGLTLVLDGVHDPYNISAAVRSAEGFGLQHVHIIGAAESLPMSRAITKGCHKWLSLHYHSNGAACAGALHAQQFELWAATPGRQTSRLEQFDFSRRIALVFGAERFGISEQLLACCDGTYAIPMAGFSQSLNVSVAVAISLHVAAARRRHALGSATDLSPDEVEALAAEWIQKDNAQRQQRNCGSAAAQS